MPVGDREAHVLLHRFAIDHLSGIVVAKSQGVLGARAFVSDGPDVLEMRFFGHDQWGRSGPKIPFPCLANYRILAIYILIFNTRVACAFPAASLTP
jgi:hypothetical protein